MAPAVVGQAPKKPAIRPDAGPLDAGPLDAGPLDAGPLDAKVRADLLQWNEAARTHVRSTAIVRGVLHVDSKSFEAAVAKTGYVQVRVAVRETIFGPVQPNASFRVFVRQKVFARQKGVANKAWETSSEDVASWEGKDRIVFLMMGDGGNYLASNNKAHSTLEPTRKAIVRVRQREMLHRELLSKPLRQDRKLQKQAMRWVKRMTGGKDMQLEAFDGLEEMGAAATVEIIAAMDSRRALPEASITLQNRAKDRFEAARHHSPKLAVDAIAAILNQNTGESFGFIYNEASDAARASCVRGWTLYAHYLVSARDQQGPGKQATGKQAPGKKAPGK